MVDDSTRTTANTFTFDSTNLQITGIGYNIDLGAAAEAGFFITTGTAADTVNVLGTFDGQALTLDSAGGADTVNIGNAGSLADILAAVNVNNAASVTALNIDASADGAATYTVTETQITSSLASAPINFNANQVSTVTLTAGGEADTITAAGVSGGQFDFTADGGDGDDLIIGTNGDDVLRGGAGNDTLIGGRGADIGLMGDGDDLFVWNPGDGSDTVEGGAGTDTLVFNGSNGSEAFTVGANGGRVRFTRSLGNIVMDLDDVEGIDLNALGGADTVTTGDLTGTDLAALNVDLAGVLGGATGDAELDAVTVNGTGLADMIVVSEAAGLVTITGAQPTTVTVKNFDPADTLTVLGLGGDDVISAEGVAAGVFAYTADGGDGNDTLIGTDGNDTLSGGAGDDFVEGERGADIALLGPGNDVFEWDPGDGSDTVEGGAGIDELRFNGSNGSEAIDVSANGPRVRFFRDLGNITMDLNEIERVTFNALGGADTVVVNDLSGTAVTDVFVNLGGSLETPSVGDGRTDTVTVVGTPGDDTITARVVGGEIQVLGLPAVTHVTGTDPSGDRLLVQGGGGNDAIDLSATVPVLPQPGLTSTVVVGADAGGAPVVTTIAPDGTVVGATTVFDPSFTGGVRVIRADVNGDGVEDTIVGTGPGIATQVRVLDGKTGAELFSFSPFEASFTGGVFLAAGDLNGDGKAEVIVTPDQGGGPRVLVFNGADGSVLADFFGIDDPNFRGGARAAVGDLNGDGTLDLLVAAGFGGGPRVAGFDGQSIAANAPVKLFNDFFVFEQTLRNGVFITAGDLDGDGFADVIVGGGPGGGPRVFAVSGKDLVQSGSDNLVQVANFFAGDPDNRGGVRVAVKNLDGDTNADLVVGDGTGAGSRVTAYAGSTIPTAGTPPELFALDAFADFPGGVFVG